MSEQKQASPGIRLDPYFGFSFLVEIEALTVAGFSEVTGLQAETVTETYREGGVNDFEHKLAGPIRYPGNLVLKRGITAVGTLWDWYAATMSGTIKRKNGSIILLSPSGIPAMVWGVIGAYPVKWSGPDFHADSSAVAFESIEMAHNGLTRLGGAVGRLPWN